MIGRRGAAAAAALVLLAWGGTAAADTIPAALQPPGARLLFTAEASGVQIYRSVAEAGGPPHWVLEAPLARLTGDTVSLYHYAGPSWEAADGSKVARDPAVPVVSVLAPDAADDIPWLLVTVAADPAPGAKVPGTLGAVAYVQRLATHGGAAPSAPPLRPDTRVGVPYTATYAFLAKAQ
ncbi:hypothetical protein E9232_007168 [Inquilinus ginsengisoli]|uniref:DUF3455 domain-containing protein n=1 Tax=Inquilinus ginsengisoli TaxID=363840 RepID=A0ABU1K155_9PROT|nr:DUF3455 domain-containing protein [Inquilinus ginsengisoli]MDR6294613.1 hypothetical protein [Inquilinus ginsengisoli]